MKNIRAAVALFLIAVFLAGVAYATTSSINPNVPAQNSPLSSSVLRGNYGAAYNDINTLFGIDTLSSNQLLGTVNAGMAGGLNIPSCATGALSWTPGTGLGCNSINGLVSPITTSLIFTGTDSFNLNAVNLPTKQSGTVLQIGNADSLASRLENQAFSGAAYFTGVRSDGTNAAPTTLQLGDEIAAFNAWGYNGSSIVGPRAAVRAFASQNWTGSAQGTYVSITTAPNGSTAAAEVCRFENDGGVDCPATVTGGDQGAGKINAAGLFVNGVAVSVGTNAFSSLTAATTTNSIENGANAQVWNWDALTTGTALTLSSTGITTGTELSVSAANAAGTGYAGYFSNTGTGAAYGVYAQETGAANTGYAGYFSNTATATGYALYANGAAKISGNLTVTGTCTGCGSAGGSGTVNSGTATDLAFYNTTTNAVSDATGLQYNSTTKGLNLNGVNAHSLPDNGTDTTGVSIGANAYLLGTSTGQNSTAVGASALAAQTTGVGNTAIGYHAGASLTTDGYNTAIGLNSASSQAAANTTSANGNVAVGAYALNANISGNANLAIGNAALLTSTAGTGKVAIGDGALQLDTGTGVNMGVGVQALGSFSGNASGQNTAVGYQAGQLVGSGVTSVTLLGYQTGVHAGSNETIIGSGTCNGGSCTPSSGVIIGSNGSSMIVSGANNTLIGYQVGNSTLTTGTNNVIVGAVGETTALATTTSFTGIGTGVKGGSSDTAVGGQALHATSTNNNLSTAVGYQAGAGITSGTNNTAVGYQALDAGTAVSTGTNNTALGYQAQTNSATATNRTAIGYQAISTADNDVVLGNSSVATIHAEVTSITGISDRRHKTDIKPLDLGLDFITGLKPVSFRLKSSDYQEHFGFIAQDTENALPNPYRSIIDGKDPRNKLAIIEIQDNKEGTYHMNYGELIGPLVKAVQDLKVANDNQQKEIDELKAKIKAGN